MFYADYINLYMQTVVEEHIFYMCSFMFSHWSLVMWVNFGHRGELINMILEEGNHLHGTKCH